MSVNNWRIFCDTESDWSYGFLDASLPAPTVCFNNTQHSVNLESQQIVKVVGNDIVNAKIIETTAQINGNFRCQGFSMNIEPGPTGSLTLSWPYTICVLESFFTSKSQDGDVINCTTGPNTIVSVLGSDLSSGSTVIPVTQTFIEHAYVGYEILINGVNLGEIISIDPANMTATIVTPTTQIFTAGGYIGIQQVNIINFVVNGDVRVIIGRSKIGAKTLPPNMNVLITYTNNQSVPILFTFQVEYLY